MRSTSGERIRRRRSWPCWPWRCRSWLSGPAWGNTGICGWLIMASHSVVSGGTGRCVALARELPLAGGGALLRAGGVTDRGASVLLVVSQRAERAGAREHLLGLRQRVGRGAEQGARDRAVCPRGDPQDVVEGQGQDEGAGRGPPRLQGGCGVQSGSAGAGRAVRGG